jgi:two-component system, OmpR family, KDP operon response regulator KdpE
MGEPILVVEDEPGMARVLQVGLEARGYDVRVAATGQQALAAVGHEEPAVVLLDLGLPDMDGLDVSQRIQRSCRCSIIVLTADGAEDRKIGALDGGAVDYVTKPFSIDELLARIRVALRHRHAVAGIVDDTVLIVGRLHIDVAAHAVRDGDRDVVLTAKEFKLLTLLARNTGKVLTHRLILDQVWEGSESARTESLRVLVNGLRRKLQDDPDAPRLLTEPGVGYRLVDGT